jgi:TonB family protein
MSAARPLPTGYGLPCAKCGRYFPAGLEACPNCKGRERVSPVVAPVARMGSTTQTPAKPVSGTIALRQGEEKFPKDLSPVVLVGPATSELQGHGFDQAEPAANPPLPKVQASAEPVPDAIAPNTGAALPVDVAGDVTAVPDESPVMMRTKESDAPEPKTRTTDESADVSVPASLPPSPKGRRRLDGLTLFFTVLVVACAVLMTALVDRRVIPHRAKPNAAPAAKSASATESSTQPRNAEPPTADASLPATVANSTPTLKKDATSTAKEHELRVLPTARLGPSSPANPAPVFELPSELVEESLLHRVEPEYPAKARDQGIQGLVVLDLHIGKNGAVRDVALVGGQPVLADAATSAVKQWRFKPHYEDGRTVEMQTRITMRFALPNP